MFVAQPWVTDFGHVWEKFSSLFCVTFVGQFLVALADHFLSNVWESPV